MKGENELTFLEALPRTRHYREVGALTPMLVVYRGHSSPQFASEGVEARGGGRCVLHNAPM